MLAHLRFPSMKRLGVLLLLLDEMLVHDRVPREATRCITILTPGRDASPSQGTQHEETWGITTPPGWGASPSQGTQYEATRSITTPPWMGY